MTGRLFVCATPIGNLEDVTLRVLRVLAEVDLVAAEDTRRTRKLLSRHQIKATLVSYHEANERAQAEFLIGRMRAGIRVALVTDAGMPGISDPGFQIVRRCIEEQIPVEVIPGASSILAALIASGIGPARFCFDGFVPRKAGERIKRLKQLASEERTVVFFESPSRVKATLEAFLHVLGDRNMALARELTKVHEEVIRGKVSEVLQRLADPVLGEIVLVVEGAGPPTGGLDAAVAEARSLVAGGMAPSRAAAEAAKAQGGLRRSVYEALLSKSGEE